MQNGMDGECQHSCQFLAPLLMAAPKQLQVPKSAEKISVSQETASRSINWQGITFQQDLPIFSTCVINYPDR